LLTLTPTDDPGRPKRARSYFTVKNDSFSVAGYALMDATVKYDLARFGLPGSSVGVNVVVADR
jgi:hypothetical protein